MTHLDKLKKLIKTGDPENIGQALALAEALYEEGSKEMKELEEFLSEVLEDIAYKTLDNERGTWATSDYKNLWHFAIPLWTEIALEYRDAKIIAKVSLEDDDGLEWNVERWSANDEFVLTKAHEKVIMKHLNLPVSKEFIVEDLGKLEDAVWAAKAPLLRKVDKGLQEAVNKIGKRYYSK